MKILTMLTLAVLLAIVPAWTAEGFTPLFNGTDFTGWKSPSPYWVIEDGVLLLENRTDGKMRNDYYLWTEEVFGDFILELEFKVPEGRANSGVFIRTSDLSNPVQTGMEVQVGNASPDRPLTRGSVGGLYNLVAPNRNVYKLGEWNHYRITCEGPNISIALNGEVVSEANLDLWTEPQQNPDGTRNKFKTPLKDFAREGHIGFQDHGSPASYRNIKIKRLNQ